jgi:hypothetical protein
MSQMLPFLIGAGVILLLAFIYFMVRESSRCPACKEVFVVKHLDTVETGRRKGYRVISREEKDRKGRVVRRWDEQIRIMTVDYQHNHVCKNCQYEWSTVSSVELDNFDD